MSIRISKTAAALCAIGLLAGCAHDGGGLGLSDDTIQTLRAEFLAG
jgi:hypothetical protein